MAADTHEAQKIELTYEQKLAEANFYHEASNQFERQVMLPVVILIFVVMICLIFTGA